MFAQRPPLQSTAASSPDEGNECTGDEGGVSGARDELHAANTTTAAERTTFTVRTSGGCGSVRETLQLPAVHGA